MKQFSHTENLLLRLSEIIKLYRIKEKTIDELVSTIWAIHGAIEGPNVEKLRKLFKWADANLDSAQFSIPTSKRSEAIELVLKRLEDEIQKFLHSN